MFAKGSVALVSLLLTHTVYAAGPAEWSNVSVFGSGCRGESVVLSPDANEMEWNGQVFGFDISGIRSTTSFCRLSASVKVAEGFYLEEVEETPSYGVSKSAVGSVFEVGTGLRYFTFDVAQTSNRLEEGEGADNVRLNLKGRHSFGPVVATDDFCKPDAVRSGLFQATVSTVGQASEGGHIRFGSALGQPIQYKLRFKWAPCKGQS